MGLKLLIQARIWTRVQCSWLFNGWFKDPAVAWQQMAYLLIDHGHFSDGLTPLGIFLGSVVSAVAVSKMPELDEVLEDEGDEIDGPNESVLFRCDCVPKGLVLNSGLRSRGGTISCCVLEQDLFSSREEFRFNMLVYEKRSGPSLKTFQLSMTLGN